MTNRIVAVAIGLLSAFSGCLWKDFGAGEPEKPVESPTPVDVISQNYPLLIPKGGYYVALSLEGEAEPLASIFPNLGDPVDIRVTGQFVIARGSSEAGMSTYEVLRASSGRVVESIRVPTGRWAISGDGSWIAGSLGGWRLYLIDRESGKSARVVDLKPSTDKPAVLQRRWKEVGDGQVTVVDYGSLAWQPNSTTLWFVLETQEREIKNLASSPRSNSTSIVYAVSPEEDPRAVVEGTAYSWNHSGTSMAYVHDDSIWLYDPADGAKRRLLRVPGVCDVHWHPAGEFILFNSFGTMGGRCGWVDLEGQVSYLDNLPAFCGPFLDRTEGTARWHTGFKDSTVVAQLPSSATQPAEAYHHDPYSAAAYKRAVLWFEAENYEVARKACGQVISRGSDKQMIEWCKEMLERMDQDE